MIRVKICGITCGEDARAACAAGTDAIGLNFVSGPRQIDVESAADILESLNPLCTPVALIDVSSGDVPAELLDLLGRYWVSHVQMYGRVTSETIARLRGDGLRPILVGHVRPERFPGDVQTLLGPPGPARPSAVLLDAGSAAVPGGTGRTADWELITAAQRSGQLADWPPLMLAGGLNPGNVAAAIAAVRPWAVDVSSGVECSPGRKDPDLMRAFVVAARNAGS